MRIKSFALEEWCNLYEYSSKYNLGETCVCSISLDELFEMTGVDGEKILKDFSKIPLTYGYLGGRPSLLEGVSKLYKTVSPGHVISSHGAAGANLILFSALAGPGAHVVTIMPAYQQLYSLPEYFGGSVDILHLKREDEFLPDLDELRRLVRKDTNLICINNPHNPSGNLMPTSLLQDIVEIAREAGAYLLCDETYRHLTQEELYCESVVDLYGKGISVSSMTKTFSLAGLRVGWVVTKDHKLKEELFTYREYSIVSGSMFDEYIAGIALEHTDVLLGRSKKIIRENLKVLCDWVNKQPHISMIKPRAATLAMLYYDYDVDSYTFCREAQEKESVFLMPGKMFELKDNCFRLGFACAKKELEEGLEALSRFLHYSSFPIRSK